jgi:hypothetical protein
VTGARAQRRRARLAVVACLLWLAGVEVLPAIHEATHGTAAPHVHAPNGMIVTVSFGEPTHVHADGTIHTAADEPLHPPSPTKRRGPDGRSRVRSDASHAAGLAHHAEALIAAAPPITKPLPVDLRPTLVAIAATAEPIQLDPLAPHARGPPLVAS